MNLKLSKSKLYLKSIEFIFIWCIMQDFVLSTLYNFLNNSALINILFYSKDVLFIALFLKSLNKINFHKFYGKLLISYLTVVIIAIFIALIRGGSFANIAQNIRSAVLLPCFVNIGYSIADSRRKEFDTFVKTKYMRWIFASVIFGLLDYVLDKFVGTKDIWRTIIGFTNFMTDIKHQSGRLVYGLPGNFYGYSSAGYFSRKRLVGFWGNPLTSGYSLLIPSFYYLLSLLNIKAHRINIRAIKVFLGCMLIISGVFLSYTRIVIVLLIFIFSIYAFLNARKYMPALLTITVGLLAFLFSIDYSSIMRFLYDGSTIGHINNLNGAIDNIRFSLFGHGINYAGAEGASGIGTESTYMTLFGNVGVVGLALFTSLLLYLLRCIQKVFKYSSNMTRAVFLSGLGLMVTGLISEQLLAYTTIAPFYILLGYEYANSGKNLHNTH